MREILNSSVFGNIETEVQKKIRNDINERWDRLGLCEGLDGHLKETVATLYENQAKHLIYEATASDNSGSFETVVFPLIRRVFSKLLANDIVSVQAMNLPVGKLFFIKPITSERKWSAEDLADGVTGRHTGLMGYERENRHYNGEAFNANDERTWKTKNRFYLPDEVVKATQTADGTEPKVTQYMKKSLYDLFYNDFLFDNSKGKITIKVGTVKPVILDGSGEYKEVANLADYPVDARDGSVRHIILQVGGFSSYNAGRLTGPDGNEMDSESFMASLKVIANADIPGDDDYTGFKAGESIPFRFVSQKYGTQIVDYGPRPLCDAKGHIQIELDLMKPVKKQNKTLDGFIGVDPTKVAALDVATAFNVAWAQYDSLELETEMGEVSFNLLSETVSVEERKLRATWSPELAQDVSAFHNIDAEAELTAILSEQIAAEIDREILRDLRKAAPWQLRWDARGWQRQNTTSTVYTQKDWNQTLLTTVNQISAQIHKSTLRGGANWAVVSSEINALLNDLEYFHVTDANAEADTYNMGIEKVGSLQGRIKVIVDPYAPHWSMILGHHGSSLLDTGYIYAPYVPMALTPVMYNPMNFAPIKGISTRYAKKLVNNKYYGAIRVDGLVHFNPNELR
nr:MAG TPA: Major capsid protein [Caudoviricetes sp.]